jgi:hypothetical protein
MDRIVQQGCRAVAHERGQKDDRHNSRRYVVVAFELRGDVSQL